MSLFDNIVRLLQTPDTLQTHSVYTHPKSVVLVGGLLSVTEFEVFQIAYRQWFGVEGPATAIERAYKTYVYEQVVPHWVRHFCQKIQKLRQSGELDPRRFTQHRDRRPGMSKNILLA